MADPQNLFCKIIIGDSRDMKHIKDKSVNLIVTSPPYFKKEIYSDEQTNSCNAYPEYGQWVNNFLHPMILKTYESLKDDCFYLLNIEDVKINNIIYSLVNDSVEYGKKIGFEHINNENLAFRNSGKTCIENVGLETIIVLKKRKRGKKKKTVIAE